MYLVGAVSRSGVDTEEVLGAAEVSRTGQRFRSAENVRTARHSAQDQSRRVGCRYRSQGGACAIIAYTFISDSVTVRYLVRVYEPVSQG